MIAELKKHYIEQVIPEMTKTRGYKNIHEVPAIKKIVINSGLDASLDKNAVEETAKEIGLISGQKPIITKARKSVSNFKVREGMPLGVKVTLRGNAMYDFLSRLINVALPGIRDFRGVSNRCDGNGNYTLGIADQSIFPESSLDHNKRTIGMDISIITSANSDDEAQELLRLMGMPFRKRS
ncbi:MAG: 50S ribosomal protein L5 [Verrucomicrobiota bacterium]|nr:50S ribosomal protein L5 [Verrucomicrobiota bacterium]